MSKRIFINCIEKKSISSQDEFTEIENLRNKYPWSTHLNMLVLKYRTDNKNQYCDDLLTQTSFSLYQRKKLYFYLNNIRLSQEQKNNNLSHFENETLKSPPTNIENSDIQQTVQEFTDNNTSFQTPAETIPQERNYKQWCEEANPDKTVPKYEKPSHGVQHTKKSQEELLMIVQNRLKELEEEKKQSVAKQKSADSISTSDKDREKIENFIHHPPFIKFEKNSRNESDMSEESSKENFNVVSETLAEIHVSQGNISHATTIYKQLILKYPEKSIYFAKKIEDLTKSPK